MKKIMFSIGLMLCTYLVTAQFSSQGKIDYERKTNIKLQMQNSENSSEWFRSMIKKMAQYTISDFTMSFNSEASEYEFVKEREVTGETFSWWGKPCRENKVYTDFKTRKVQAQKQVYENNYLVEGDMSNLKWKIEDDMRIIAGYACRKATTRICDSVVVVAFYTDQIMVSGGPEGFNGLPGMILGLAVPRLYTTWFATNVQLTAPEVKAFTPARKSKKVNSTDVIAEIQKSTKNWGEYGTSLIWWLSL